MHPVLYHTPVVRAGEVSVANVSERLRDVVQREAERLRALGGPALSARPAPGKWCANEILGHLVDSAANNHQRFVRAALEGGLVFPGYAQDGWVSVQRWAEEDWSVIVELWIALNRHLVHLLGGLPADALSAPCRIGERPPVPLAVLAEDYLRHLEHHLATLP
jgi:hypothetical protein